MKRISELMAETEEMLELEPETIEPERLARIKARTLGSVGGGGRRRRRTVLRPLVVWAALLLLVLGAAALDPEQLWYVIFSKGEQEEGAAAEELGIFLPDRLGEYTLRNTNVKTLSAQEEQPREDMEGEYTTLNAIYLPEGESEVDMTAWNTLALEVGKTEGELWALHFGFDPETGEWVTWPEHPNYPGLTYSEPEVMEYGGHTLYLSRCTFTVQETDAMGAPTGKLMTATDQNVLWLDEEKGICFRLTVHPLAELEAEVYARQIIDGNG